MGWKEKKETQKNRKNVGRFDIEKNGKEDRKRKMLPKEPKIKKVNQEGKEGISEKKERKEED